MEKLLAFDFSAFLVMFVLLSTTISRRMIHGKENRIFLATLACAFLTTVFDVWSIVLDVYAEGALTLKYISHSLYLFFHSLMVVIYICYIVSLADIWHRLKRNILHKILLPLPMIIVTILLISNFFTHKVFYMNAEGHYTRGSLFAFIYLAGFAYAIYGIFFILANKVLFKRSRFWALMSVFLLVFAATFLQMFMPGIVIEMFATTIGLLFISMIIQKPEENIDLTTGLQNATAYSIDIKRNFHNEKVFDIIMINVANFHSVRDIIGFDAANDLLVEVANKLRAVNKSSKLNSDLYYLGKGKFRLTIDEDMRERSLEIAELVNTTLQKNFDVNHINLNLICYVCITRCPYDVDDYEILMHFGERFTDNIEYSGNVLLARELFSKERYDLFNKLDSIIENAITNHKFQVYYQPIYSTEEKRFNSAEALLRLKDDTYGFIPPDVFIPAAEKSGAIHRIGAYVLEEVCDFIASSDLPKLNIDYIEINLSVAQCMHQDLSKQVLNILDKYKVSPDKINLEITETATSNLHSIMLKNLQELTEAGVSFSLDDFGTGYSNMQRVASLPLKIVKLDRTFVNHEENPKLSIVLENTVKMIKDMDMQIVAEGIETEQLVTRFADMKCEYIQGYYFSKPIPRNDFIVFITKHLNSNK
ncbi:MAG: EAL domain-containing protein [Lachnospiraceae bacterium]|nr:EAL domain-containing protein [Lachnospiraceae bacterium]MBQ8319201.1 EAL domain-containing protein [Lachnospiraceae bacterium]